MTILISASVAFDNIMMFPDRFAKHILADQIHILNVAFEVPTLQRQFGGCAGNIAYSLAQLGGKPTILATVGEDSDLYRTRLKRLGLSQVGVRTIAATHTAQCFIITDVDNNQITAFHPGAMSFSHDNPVPADMDISPASLALVGPAGKDGMWLHAKTLHERGFPFIYDPGQSVPLFSGEELLQFLRWSQACVLNDYEARLMENKTGLSSGELAKLVDVFIVTLGEQGARIYQKNDVQEIPAVRAEKIKDPTGCGDAFRAGLLWGRTQGLDWLASAGWGAKIAARKIAFAGAQGHELSPEDCQPPHR